MRGTKLDSRGRRRGRLDVPRRRIQTMDLPSLPTSPSLRPNSACAFFMACTDCSAPWIDSCPCAWKWASGGVTTQPSRTWLPLERAPSASGDRMRGCAGKGSHFEFGQCGVWRRCLAWRPCRTRRDVHLFERRNGQLKAISSFAKTARAPWRDMPSSGHPLPSELEEFRELGYRFSSGIDAQQEGFHPNFAGMNTHATTQECASFWPLPRVSLSPHLGREASEMLTKNKPPKPNPWILYPMPSASCSPPTSPTKACLRSTASRSSLLRSHPRRRCDPVRVRSRCHRSD